MFARLGESHPLRPPEEIAWGDVDCDGDLDSVDALGILRSIAALPVVRQQPCPSLGSAVVVTQTG